MKYLDCETKYLGEQEGTKYLGELVRRERFRTKNLGVINEILIN